MTNNIAAQNRDKSLQPLLKELREIKYYLKKLLLVIPAESLKEYQNASEIKKAFSRALKSFPPTNK